MNVCLDIQPAIGQLAGVGRYTRSLAEYLGKQAGPDELTLFYFDFSGRGRPFPVNSARHKVVRWCPGRVAQKAWNIIGWPPFDWFAGSADVYHFPNFVRPPLKKGRSVVTIHDVSFLRFPDTTERKNLHHLRTQIRNTVECADMIVTDSRFSAGEIMELLDVPEDRVQAVHLGLTPNMASTDTNAIGAMRKALMLDRPYILFVGTLEPRKNLPFLIETYEKLEFFDGDLVLAGMRGWKYGPILDRIRISSRKDTIRYLEYVDEQYMPALYAGAEAFVYPSLYEGFGFPPLEAMMCGTPVISSTAGSLPEVLGISAEFIPGFDSDNWAGRIQALLEDNARLETLKDSGKQHASSFRWEETAGKMWEIYRHVSG